MLLLLCYYYVIRYNQFFVRYQGHSNLYSQMWDLQQEENWYEVLKLCDRIIKETPDDFQAYISKGNAHMERHEYKDAAKAYKIARDNDYTDNKTDQWMKKLDLCLQIISVDGKMKF